jgi:hypothetical protein
MPNRAIVHAYQMRLYKLICAYEILIGLVNLWGKASTWHMMEFQLTGFLNVLWIFIGSVCKKLLAGVYSMASLLSHTVPIHLQELYSERVRGNS